MLLPLTNFIKLYYLTCSFHPLCEGGGCTPSHKLGIINRMFYNCSTATDQYNKTVLFDIFLSPDPNTTTRIQTHRLGMMSRVFYHCATYCCFIRSVLRSNHDLIHLYWLYRPKWHFLIKKVFSYQWHFWQSWCWLLIERLDDNFLALNVNADSANILVHLSSTS